MNARRTVWTLFVLLLATWSIAGAADVTWIQGTTPPATWAIDPVSPGTSAVIQFSGPTPVHSNACEAEKALGGTPQLSINSVSRVITLWFQGPVSGVCPMIYMPVCGLEGEFGPLEAGEWVFRCLARDVGFEIRFTVGGNAVHHVDADAPGPVFDGTTWARAFRTLQDALAVAVSGDQIVVAEGVYRPDRGTGIAAGDREATFELKDGLVVKGGYAGYGKPSPDARNVSVYETILSGDLNGDDLWGILNRDDNSYQVVTGPLGNPGAVLDGFSIMHGHGDGPFPHNWGGGLYNPGGDLMMVNCAVEGNTAAFGGGILNLGGALTLVNTHIVGNRAFLTGGGLYNYEGSAVLHNCRLVGNSADLADAMGGAAVNNLTGTLKILNSTIADNLSPNGEAITSYSWDWDAALQIDIANSILYNGGEEIWSNNMPAVSVNYSNVQGGWTGGTDNLNAAPQFVAPGGRSIEGEWIDGDYRLKGTSACIDAGSDSSLPADIADLDGDGNAAEQIPFDLAGEARTKDTRVDMGAYEQLKSSTPGPAPSFSPICVFGHCLTLGPIPGSSNSFIGSTVLTMDANFKAKFTAQVDATSAAGGTWTGWFDPDVLGPGTDLTTTLWVKGENLDLSALPAGSTNVQVAEVHVFVAPAP